MTPADGKWRAYLLGHLAAEEAQALEERYFGEEAVFEEVVLAEDDLIDEYLDAQLEGDDRRAFEERLQDRPELAARLEARRRLTRALRRRVDADVPPRVGRRQIVLGLAAAAAAVFVSVRAFQEKPIETPRTSLPTRPSAVARLETAPPAGASPATAEVMVLLLGAGGVRDKSSVPSVKRPSSAPALRLVLNVGAPSGRALEVVLEDVDGATVWKGTGQVVTKGPAPQAQADVPVSVLAPGDYIVRFKGLPGGEDEAFFRVLR